MTRLPHVTATPIEPDRSSVVMLCLFRLCDWTSPDTRTMHPHEQDLLVQMHLLDAHGTELTLLAQVARDAGLIA